MRYLVENMQGAQEKDQLILSRIKEASVALGEKVDEEDVLQIFDKMRESLAENDKDVTNRHVELQSCDDMSFRVTKLERLVFGQLEERKNDWNCIWKGNGWNSDFRWESWSGEA